MPWAGRTAGPSARGTLLPGFSSPPSLPDPHVPASPQVVPWQSVAAALAKGQGNLANRTKWGVDSRDGLAVSRWLFLVCPTVRARIRSPRFGQLGSILRTVVVSILAFFRFVAPSLTTDGLVGKHFRATRAVCLTTERFFQLECHWLDNDPQAMRMPVPCNCIPFCQGAGPHRRSSPGNMRSL